MYTVPFKLNVINEVILSVFIIFAECHSTQCRYAQSGYAECVMLNVILLSVAMQIVVEPTSVPLLVCT